MPGKAAGSAVASQKRFFYQTSTVAGNCGAQKIQKKGGKGMHRGHVWLLPVLAVALAVVFLSGPAFGAWTWNSSNKLTFNFDNVDPTSPLEYSYTDGEMTSTFMTRAAGESTIYISPFTSFGGPWYAKFSDPLGSLSIQNTAADYRGRLLLRCHTGQVVGGVTNTFSAADLDWDKGVVVEVDATTMGARDAAEAPYTWAGSSKRGGFELSFGTLGAEMCLSWLTHTPASSTDDSVYISDDNSAHPPFAEVAYPLGGDETNPPRNKYKMTVRKSPLPVTPENGVMLVNVFVDKGSGYERVITNVTASNSKSDSYDSISIGKRDNVQFGSWGNEYHSLEIYENDSLWASDTTPPSAPSNLVASAQGSQMINLSWNASTDDGEVIGYRLYRGTTLLTILSSSADQYLDAGRQPGTTYTYSLYAVDWNGNVSAEAGPVTATTSSSPSVLTFNFDNAGNATYNVLASPNYFYSEAAEDTGVWFGQKFLGGGTDGRVYYQNTTTRYQYVTSTANGGSLTVQTSCVEDPAVVRTERSFIESSTFGSFFRFMRVPDYPTPGKTYIQGTMVEVDMSFVGDEMGWCAAWPAIEPLFPAIEPCSATLEMGHQGSDWGSGWGPLNGIQITVGKNMDLIEPGFPAGSGLTKDGAQYWVGFHPNDIRNGSDDRISLYNTGSANHGTFRLLDPAGFNLKAEDGTDTGCKDGGGVPYPRDGVIQGDCNAMKIKIAIAPTGEFNGNRPFAHWDIWIKRPGDADYLHINPMTAVYEGGETTSTFGDQGHTIKACYYARDQGDKSHLKLGNQAYHNLYGWKHNQVIVRNDWNGTVIIPLDHLSDVRKLGLGTRVQIDATGGEKIVTMDPITFDMATYFFYIEEEDRSFGIRVRDTSTMMPMVMKGQKISALDGFLGRDEDGNYFIDITNMDYTADSATKTIEPVGMNNLTVGGEGQTTGGVGLPNVGLLATVWGEVTHVESDPATGNLYFKLNDGSGTEILVADSIFDGTLVTPLPVVGEYYTATGAIALQKDPDSSLVSRVLILDNAKKIK